MTSSLSGGGHSARVPPLWVASYGSQPPPVSWRPTLIGQREASRKLYLMAETGNRPSVSEGRACSVLLSGWLHQEFELAGAPDGSTSDADVVRHAYLRRGEIALRALRGSFSLLIHDFERDCLIAVRDPLGYHPLFFAEHNDSMLFSPSQDELLALGVSKEVDRAVAVGWICYRWLDARDTFFVEISRLLPGHLVRASGGGLSVHRYWDPRGPERSEAADFDLVHREFDGLLRRSVARNLDLGPTAIYLSGGIDSATIAAVATDVSRERGLPDPWALSLRFPDPESDESTVQRAVGEALGLPQVLVPIEEAFGSDGGVIETFRAGAEAAIPPMNPWLSAFGYLARQALDRGCRTVLGGDWSEWLHAERALAADLLLRLDLVSLHSLYESERRYYEGSRSRTAQTLIWRSGLRLLLRRAAAAILVRFGAGTVLAARRRRELLRPLPGWVAPDPALRREHADRWASLPEPGWGDFERRARASLLASPSTVLMDRYYDDARRHGIEYVDPFQDRDLVESLLSISPRHLFHRKRVKALAEASIRQRSPRLDPTILRAAYYEQAFQSMLARDWTRALEFTDGLPVLGDQQIVASSALGTGSRRRIFPSDLGYREVWAALALESWLQRRLDPSRRLTRLEEPNERMA